MWLPNSAALSGPNNISKPTLFIAQAWRELLSPTPPDNFQARALDLPMLLQELDEVAEFCAEDERWITHLAHVTEELKDACFAEAAYLETALGLKRALEFVTGSASGTSPRIVRERVKIALDQFGPLHKRWTEHALKLSQGDGRNKREILSRLSTVATHVLNRGQDEESLIATEDLAGIRPPELIEKISACLTENKTDYRCVIAVSGDVSHLASIISSTKFSRAGKGSGIQLDPVSKAWQQSFPGAFFVVATFAAFSRRLAAELCLQEVSTLLNVHNLYTNSAQYRAEERVLVYCDSAPPHEVNISPGKHFGLFARSRDKALTQQTFAAVGARLDGRIANAME